MCLNLDKGRAKYDLRKYYSLTG